jgi:hypothetical protein
MQEAIPSQAMVWPFQYLAEEKYLDFKEKRGNAS